MSGYRTVTTSDGKRVSFAIDDVTFVGAARESEAPVVLVLEPTQADALVTLALGMNGLLGAVLSLLDAGAAIGLGSDPAEAIQKLGIELADALDYDIKGEARTKIVEKVTA